MLHNYVLRVHYSCGVAVVVFWFWWEIVFVVTYVLSVRYTFGVVSVCLVVAGNSSQNGNTSLQKKSYWFTLLWSASWCVYFIRPNTLLLCIFLFCMFLLYLADPQVEVQIRILLKDKYKKLSQNANTGNHTLISWTMLIGFIYFRETTRLPRFLFHKIWTFYYCISLSCFV